MEWRAWEALTRGCNKHYHNNNDITLCIWPDWRCFAINNHTLGFDSTMKLDDSLGRWFKSRDERKATSRNHFDSLNSFLGYNRNASVPKWVLKTDPKSQSASHMLSFATWLKRQAKHSIVKT